MTPREFIDWLEAPVRRTLVMGVLNVTPDSFSDGGRFAAPDAAIAQARRMIDEGADLIDIGGESTRPGAAPVPPEEQIRRVIPAIKRLAPFALSIDTTSAEVASAALDAGACIINDISAGRFDGAMLPLAAQRGCPIILMHMQGTPATMQQAPCYGDVTGEVAAFLQERVAAAEAAGVARNRILIDPGLGFGKTTGHNLALLRELGKLAALGPALVIGASRKRFIGQITGEDSPSARVHGTVATSAWAVAHGAGIVRVHDVRPNAQGVAVIGAILGEKA